MATNYVQPGNTVTLTAPYQRDTGKGAKVGAIFGVALQTVANAVDGEFGIRGVWTLDKTSAQAWSQGDRIYWDDSNKRCDSDATVGMFIGVALEAADNPSSTGVVLLCPGAELVEGKQAAITSLTDNTGGSADNTLANLADGTTYATDHPAIENNFADLAAKINAILAALRAAGIIAT